MAQVGEDSLVYRSGKIRRVTPYFCILQYRSYGMVKKSSHTIHCSLKGKAPHPTVNLYLLKYRISHTKSLKLFLYGSFSFFSEQR